jgi:hypothetical protein
MTDSQMDEIFRKQLPGHESPVPEDMWERIIRKKDKDRKGFFFFFSLFGLFLLGFGIAGFLLFSRNNKENIPGKDHNNKVNSGLDTVKSGGIYQDLKMNPSVSQEASIGGTDTALNIASQKEYTKNRISSKQKHSKILQVSLTKEKSTPGIGQANPERNSDTPLLTQDRSLDTAKKSEGKVIPVLTLTPKPNSADSAKTVTSKKSDSTKKKMGDKWSLDLYASPDYPIDHKPQEYIKGQLSYTVGLRLNRSFGRRFSGKIGIQFSQLNYILPDSSSFPGANRVMRWDLPVLGGYSWGNENLGMTVNAGVIFNLYSSLGADSTSYIKSNTGLSLYLGFSFSKHIRERIDIFCEPYYRYQFSSMVVSPNYFPKYIDVVGISFGVRYHFKK